MDFMDQINKIDARIKAEKEAEKQEMPTVEQNNVEQNAPIPQPKMTQEQANAIVSAAKNPKDFIGLKVSTKINDLIENDDSVKDKIADVAQDTTMTGIETFTTSNKKQRKANYFDLNEKDIAPMGGDRTSSKGQQVSIVVMRRFFWILIMATLGFFYIAPLTVMVELFQGLTFKKIEKEEVTTEGEKKTKQYITRTKLGRAGSIMGLIFGLLLDVAVVAGNIFFPFVYLCISACAFTILCIINIVYSFDLTRFKKAKDKDATSDSNKSTIIVEEDE